MCSIRESIGHAMAQKFIDEIKVNQEAQQKYKDDMKRKATRQVQIVKPDATQDEVDVIMRSEGGREALYQSLILVGTKNSLIQTTVDQIGGKYEDILALEQSLGELHQMFLDMALLVERQGETLDHIEFHVQNAANDVDEANQEVHKSIVFQRRIRKKQFWLVTIAVVCIVVLVLVLFG